MKRWLRENKAIAVLLGLILLMLAWGFTHRVPAEKAEQKAGWRKNANAAHEEEQTGTYTRP